MVKAPSPGPLNNEPGVPPMPWWLLLLFIFLAWFLWAVAATLRVAVVDARNPLPDGRRRGMSPVPVIPLFPLGFFAAAKLLDWVGPPLGTLFIGSLHALFTVLLVVSIGRDCRELRARSP
jgi:hypothetical protein